jgi:antitoxin CptB
VTAPVEDPAVVRKRLRLRSWRRGTREMDLILGGFADAKLAGLASAELDDYAALLSENDHDLYQWITGSGEPPPALKPTVQMIRCFHKIGDNTDDPNH